ncbi:antitoxin Xre/MbcA/ParS toxin-binding domain-containing protein [Pseudomonas sichuanensis]|uniref:antitoxin Xre/MbcA/ParS toxin-binding domain-containing protein n=1 Tax=Pseudomonas sichuanensis TaxID=2213015 RepID=UPI00381C4739
MKTEINVEELIRHQAEQVFGSKAKADEWLAQPRAVFSGFAALEYARNEAGYPKVTDVLERIDHGYGC